MLLVALGAGCCMYFRVAAQLAFAPELRFATYHNDECPVPIDPPDFLTIDPKGPVLGQRSIEQNAEWKVASMKRSVVSLA